MCGGGEGPWGVGGGGWRGEGEVPGARGKGARGALAAKEHWTSKQGGRS